MIREYQTHSTLNPKLWDGDKLHPKLRVGFMKIAKAFYNFLEVRCDIHDVIIIGSSANYNWTEHSDIDLHVVINYLEIGDNLHIVKNYMHAKKSIWNTTHPLTYKGMNIELYAQDSDESHFSTGVYSVKNDEWITAPSKEKSQIDREVFKTKINSWKEKIENLIKNIKNDGIKSSEKQIDSLKEKLKDYRKSGLEKEGEYSYENLVFKYLRRSKLIEKLYNTIVKQTDKELSVETRKIE